MAKRALLQRVAALSAELDLPFQIELRAASEDAADSVLALCANASVAYAVYYAALREHFGRRVTLRRGGQTLASSQLGQPA